MEERAITPENFTASAAMVLDHARGVARNLGSEFVGTEHMLLALADGHGPVPRFLDSLGIDRRSLRAEIEKIFSVAPSPTVSLGTLPFSPRATRAIDLAREEARRTDCSGRVSPGHLLLGIYKENESIGYQVLLNMGVKDLDALRTSVGLVEGRGRGAELLETAPVRARVRLFREGASQGRPFLVVDGKSYTEAEEISVSGFDPKRLQAVAAAVAREHGTSVFLVSLS